VADSLLKDLTEIGTPVGTDILYIVGDPAGTPVDRKLELRDIPHDLLAGLTDDDHTQYLLATGARQATYLDISGLTGATAASRYVGATTGGAPASGTFAVGDFIIEQDGGMSVCTVAGTPGTWTAISGGGGGGDFSDGGEVGGAARTLGNTDANNMGFLANNVELLRLLSAGSVHVRVNGGSLIVVDSGDADNSRALLGDASGSGGYMILYNDAEASTAVIRSYASTNVQAYFTAGRVGFGMTDPDTVIEANGVITVNNTNAYFFHARDSGDAENNRVIIGHGAGNGAYLLMYDDDENSDVNIRTYAVSGTQVYFTAGNLAIGNTVASGTIHAQQGNAAGAIPPLYLQQDDVSEEMIEFSTTIGVGNAIEAVGAKTLTTTHFIKVTLPGALTRYIPVGTIA